MLVRRIKWASPKNLAKLALLGVFTGGTSVCYYSAVSLLPSSAALTLLFQYIWISVLIECLHKKKLPATSTIIAIVITLVGTLFATGLLDGSVAALNPLGIAYGLGSALFYALFLYYSGTLGTGQPIVLRTTMLTGRRLALHFDRKPGSLHASLLRSYNLAVRHRFCDTWHPHSHYAHQLRKPQAHHGHGFDHGLERAAGGYFRGLGYRGRCAFSTRALRRFPRFGRHCRQTASVPHKTKCGHSFVNRGRGKCSTRAMGANLI